MINAICRSSLLFGILMITKWVKFSLTSFGTLKYDCVIKTIEMFNFIPLINNLLQMDLVFYYLSYQESFHQKLLRFYVFYLYCIL